MDDATEGLTQLSVWSSDFYTQSNGVAGSIAAALLGAVSYTHLRAHETGRNLVCRLLLEKKKKNNMIKKKKQKEKYCTRVN